MKFTAKGLEESAKKTLLVAIKKYGEQYPLLYNISKDAKIRDVFRSINNLSNEISETEITEKMNASCDALCSPCGKHFLFKDYAESSETLEKLGFNNRVIYTLVLGYSTLFVA